MSELRLYCDLLLQQVNRIKENDELGDTAEVRLRFGWADEIREAVFSVWNCSVGWLICTCRDIKFLCASARESGSKCDHEFYLKECSIYTFNDFSFLLHTVKRHSVFRVNQDNAGTLLENVYGCGAFSGRHRHWKHGEVYMHHFPEDSGGMHADSKSYFRYSHGNTDSTRISPRSTHQTSEGTSRSPFLCLIR